MTLWTTAFGAWGDVIASCGNIIKLLREEGVSSCSVIYFGLDDDIVTFLEHQDFIDEVCHINLGGEYLYDALLYQAQYDFSRWLSLVGLDHLSDVPIRTHVTPELVISNDCFRDFDLKLPCFTNWHEALPKSFLLFQPYSIQSNTEGTHWPYWMESLEWILNNTNFDIVMVGRDNVPGSPDRKFSIPIFESSRVINLVNKTPSMMDVFKIASLSELVVSTANALPIWCIIKNISALVVYNSIIKDKAPYFYNWYKSEPIVTLEFDANMDDFSVVFNEKIC